MNQSQKDLKKRLLRHPDYGYSAYIPPEWEKNLFSKPTQYITDYIMKQFEAAQGEVEYYVALSYLITASNKNDDLLMEWKESPQYKRYMKSLSEEDARNKPKPLRKTQKSTEIVKKSKGNVEKVEENTEKPKGSTLKKTVPKTRIVQMKL